MGFKHEKMKTLREDLGFSLETVAKAIGSSKSYIWEIEQGRSEPSGDKVFKLAQVFGVTMDYFYTDDGTLLSKAARIGAIVLNAIADEREQPHD